MSQLLALSPWWCFVEDDGTYLQLTLVSWAEKRSSSSSDIKTTWTRLWAQICFQHRPVDPELILNRPHRHTDKATDVIYFLISHQRTAQSLCLFIYIWPEESESKVRHLSAMSWSSSSRATSAGEQVLVPLLITDQLKLQLQEKNKSQLCRNSAQLRG